MNFVSERETDCKKVTTIISMSFVMPSKMKTWGETITIDLTCDEEDRLDGVMSTNNACSRSITTHTVETALSSLSIRCKRQAASRCTVAQ